MISLFSLSPMVLPTEDAAAVASPDTPFWRLTHDMSFLRLTVADASLRAQEDAQHFDHTSADHWCALGRARGYHEAAITLRGWTHPDQHEVVLAQLAERLARAERRHASAPLPAADSSHADVYTQARCWSLRWVMTQARELCAHASAIS